MALTLGPNGQLARDVDELLLNQNDEWLQASKVVSNHLERAEDLLLRSYSASDDQAKLKELCKELNIKPPAEGRDINPEYVVNAAMRLYERAQRSWQTMQEVLREMHRMLMEQIRKITA